MVKYKVWDDEDRQEDSLIIEATDPNYAAEKFVEDMDNDSAMEYTGYGQAYSKKVWVKRENCEDAAIPYIVYPENTIIYSAYRVTE